MAQYINKDALLADVTSLIDKGKYHDSYECAFRDGNNYALLVLKRRINALEVKEVDLEKEYKDFVKCDNGRSMFETAKHFFELGMNTSKGKQ